MTTINANEVSFTQLNQMIRDSEKDIEICNCIGQRFIAAGLSGKRISINGTPGNALGAYLNGVEITVHGNAQDAVGDTMNDGQIIVHGNIGDVAGYSMRGGEIFVRDNAGYRTGIHMKEYGDKRPIIVIGGTCGSFLGEYQAGGLIIVLGLINNGHDIVGNFPCTGMHGGKIYLRSKCENVIFPKNVAARRASDSDKSEIESYIKKFCELFAYDFNELFSEDYTIVTPNSRNPYKQMYVSN